VDALFIHREAQSIENDLKLAENANKMPQIRPEMKNSLVGHKNETPKHHLDAAGVKKKHTCCCYCCHCQNTTGKEEKNCLLARSVGCIGIKVVIVVRGMAGKAICRDVQTVEDDLKIAESASKNIRKQQMRSKMSNSPIGHEIKGACVLITINGNDMHIHIEALADAKSKIHIWMIC